MWKIKCMFLIAFCWSLISATGQKLNIEYRTSLDSAERLHYLKFIDGSNCKIIFPYTSHANAMFREHHDISLKYQISNDIIIFPGNDRSSKSILTIRILNAKFVLNEDGTLFDCISGYTYVDKDQVSDRYQIYSIDGKIYRQKSPKMNGYGLVAKSYKQNRRLKKILKRSNPGDIELTILRGKKAYDKYGIVGMNGVFEIKRKD